MIINLNSQGPLVEPFFHTLNGQNHDHNLENISGTLFSTNEHESSLMNFDLTLTPPSSNNGVNQTSNSNSFGAIPNSIHSNNSLHPETISQFFSSQSDMLSPSIKSEAPTPTTVTTFDLDRNTFLTTTSTTHSSEHEHSHVQSTFSPEQAMTSLHLQSSHRNLKLSNNSSNDDFHDERICFGCRESLNTSRFILSVSGYHNWHTDCLCCSECGQSLCSSSTCYIHNGRMYCREDYQRLNECSKCRRTIGSSDWVRRAGDRLYHLACFSCDLCQRQLSTGENFTVVRHSKNDTRLLCKLHFSVRGQEENRSLTDLDVRPVSPRHSLNGENISQSANVTTNDSNHPTGLLVSTSASSALQSTPPLVTHPVNTNGQISAGSRSSTSSQQSGPTSVSSSSGTSAGGSKTKRVRTTFTEDQLSVLQANFQLDSNPDGQDLERIAALTGLSKRVTQVWFQNSRARQKKYLSKSARSGNGNGQSPNLMLSLRPGTGASGTSSTSGLWSPASSTGSADTSTQSQLPLQLSQPQQSALSLQISLPVHGANLKWRNNQNGSCSVGHISNLNGHLDNESLDDVPPQSQPKSTVHSR